MTNEKTIREVMVSFFEGVEFFEEPKVGYIWIAKHGNKKVRRNDLQLMKMKVEEGWSTLIPPSVISIDKDDYGYGYIPEFETLTIEPKEGRQYEVAVRIWSENEWKGYMINDFDSRHFLVGRNTRGH